MAKPLNEMELCLLFGTMSDLAHARLHGKRTTEQQVIAKLQALADELGSNRFNESLSDPWMATPVEGVVVLGVDHLPGGVICLIVPCGNALDEYEKLPQVVEHDGRRFGRTGWDSDKMVAFYRSDSKVASL